MGGRPKCRPFRLVQRALSPMIQMRPQACLADFFVLDGG